MDIKEKLAMLKKAEAKVLSKYSRPLPEKREKFHLPNFSVEETAEGAVYFRDTIYPLNYRYGEVFLREIGEVPLEILSFLGRDSKFASLGPRKMLFIDTETTGLAGGTGTLPFVLGAGFISEDTFVVRQYFIPDYQFEPAMLHHFNALTLDYPYFVTFNGATFDLPLIFTRMTLNRIRPAKRDYIHLDLLHPAKRLWKESIGSCTLQCLERSVLKVFREGDIPGYLIPEIYFNYLRNGNFGPVDKVLEHNLLDIVSLAVLLPRMWVHLEMAPEGNLSPSEYYSLGKIYENLNDTERSIESYRFALSNSVGEGSFAAQLRLSHLYKKRGDWEKAVEIWEKIAEISDFSVEAHIELAKYYEHKRKEIDKALKYSRQALEIVSRRRKFGFSGGNYSETLEINHRIERLQRKNGQDF